MKFKQWSEFSKGVFTGLMILVGVSIIHYVIGSIIIKETAKQNFIIGQGVGNSEGYTKGYADGRDLGADTVYQYIDNVYENGGLVIGDIAGDIIINGCTFRNVGGSEAIYVGGSRNMRVSNCVVWGVDTAIAVKKDSVVSDDGVLQ